MLVNPKEKDPACTTQAGSFNFATRLCVCVIYFSKKKPPTFVGGFLCSPYLSSWAGQGLSCRPQVSGGHLQAEKSLDFSVEAIVFALPIFPGSHPPSIVGVHVLNFCVRDGNRWTHMTINTNYSLAFTSSLKEFGDPYRIRTDVNGVRGRCLNHLTNGPCGAPSGTRTRDPLIKSQLLYQLS